VKIRAIRVKFLIRVPSVAKKSFSDKEKTGGFHLKPARRVDGFKRKSYGWLKI
jgi:hypothetical protein